jgi:gamma-glutamylputrescine oxidase
VLQVERTTAPIREEIFTFWACYYSGENISKSRIMFGLKFPVDTREHTASWYAATRHDQGDHPALEGDIEADVAIVGGGFSGVNTALELCERGYGVVVLEANRLCWGASGRNGGQIIGGLGHNTDQFQKEIGEQGVRALYDMGVEGPEIIRERVAKYDIDCDIRWGYVDVALKPRHLAWFEETQREEAAAGYPHKLELLDAQQVRQYVGSQAYLGGLLNANGGGHLHPMNLCLGEAAAAKALGAHFFEQTRVTDIEQGDRVLLRTEQGSVRAKQAVLCGNAYMGELVPQLARRVLPASSCIIATEQLSEELTHSILPQDVAACDPRTALDYFRRTSDNRLLFGGLSNYTGLVPTKYREVMQRKMLKVFPQLAGTKIEFAWDGQLGIGINRLPQLGKLADNLFYIQAYSGHGVAPTHIMARVMAEAIAGETNRLDYLSSIRHMPFPGGRYLRRPGMALGMLYFKAKDLF